MCTTRNYFTHKSKYISYGYCLRDLEQQCDRQHELQLGHMTYCGHCMIFNKYNSKCGIIYVLRLMLEAITYRTHQSFSSDAVYTFALVLLRHFPVLQIPSPPFIDGPSFSTDANSSHPLTIMSAKYCLPVIQSSTFARNNSPCSAFCDSWATCLGF